MVPLQAHRHGHQRTRLTGTAGRRVHHPCRPCPRARVPVELLTPPTTRPCRVPCCASESPPATTLPLSGTAVITRQMTPSGVPTVPQEGAWGGRPGRVPRPDDARVCVSRSRVKSRPRLMPCLLNGRAWTPCPNTESRVPPTSRVDPDSTEREVPGPAVAALPSPRRESDGRATEPRTGPR